MASSRYIVISPVRNEAAFLPGTISCMTEQTIRPIQWILVDDGSTDGTDGIVDRAAAQHPWIEAVHRTDRGFRQAGGGVIDAFYEGFDHVADPSWEFLVKFDGDLSFPPNYFERCLERFQANPKLGIGGGLICKRSGESLEPESKVDPAFHVRGATKIYRAACWHGIEGLLRQPGWDTLDEVKANMLGWITSTFYDVPLIHHRPAGGAYGTWSNWVKNGVANYIAGYHPLFMAVKCIKRIPQRPFFTAAVGLGCGYVSGYLKGVARVNDPELIKYFQRQQLRRLFFRDSLWDQKPLL